MAHPYVIRTKFPTAEEVAEIYGMPKNRIKKILRILAAGKKNVTNHSEQSAVRTKNMSQGKKRSARKK